MFPLIDTAHFTCLYWYYILSHCIIPIPSYLSSFQATNLEEGHDYYFRVFAENKAGLGNKPAELKPAVKAQLPYGQYHILT